MKLEQTFEVAAPLERVWEALIDVHAWRPACPARRSTRPRDDGTYRGSFTVKLGPDHGLLPGPAPDGGGGRGRAARRDARERPGQARPGHGEGHAS